jgi:hypothetical protein
MNCRLAAAIFLCGVAHAVPALAWWDAGHQIVANIAERRLTPAAKRETNELLALEHQRHLSSIASWADDIRRDRHETASWHFVDIPLDASRYDPARDCKDGDCVVVQIVRFAHVLADPHAKPRARLEALKFVVHFVGDIHQPLHCENHGDHGGNDVHVGWFGKPTNLHAVWDGSIIEKMGSVTGL